jgi:hypothetical protein
MSKQLRRFLGIAFGLPTAGVEQLDHDKNNPVPPAGYRGQGPARISR